MSQEEESVQEIGSVSSDSDPELASEEKSEGCIQQIGISKKEMIIESNVKPQEWVKEVERAAQKLKIIIIKSNAEEWRYHLDATKQYSSQIKAILSEARIKLERLTDVLSEILD